MEQVFTKVEELADHVKEYVNNHITSVKLSVAEKSSAVIAAAITIIVLLVGCMFFITLISIALAFAFAKLTGEYYWGFLIVAGIYLLIGVFIWKAREKIIRLPIMNAMLKKLFKEEENESGKDQ
ncbi:phage holin family protein [Ferruginibacter lapsinanis]|uniref:phage holin family protein n=1 Tax=Ferruginibacter lapsinanis TaxID=563172 RepID=UPI001E525313|nr:phage holin family protein [Ferruginibacter lapsinanis]UEG50722.1 phage holin family protein [Ferruginibacter lapsinanis]